MLSGVALMHRHLRRLSETTRRAHRRSCRRGADPKRGHRSRPKSRAGLDCDARSARARTAAARRRTPLHTDPGEARAIDTRAPRRAGDAHCDNRNSRSAD